MVADVLEEADSRPDFADDPRDFRPQVAGVLVPAELAGERKRLAGIPSAEDRNSAAKRSPVEGAQVIPDSARLQDAFAHKRRQSRGRKGFPLDVHEAAVAAPECKADAELESADAAAQADSSPGT